MLPLLFHSINPTRDGDAIQKEAFRRKFQCFRFHEKQFNQGRIFKKDLAYIFFNVADPKGPVCGVNVLTWKERVKIIALFFSDETPLMDF